MHILFSQKRIMGAFYSALPPTFCMQESADNVSQDSASPSKDALLEEACKKYDEATHLCPTLHDVWLQLTILDNVSK